MDDQPNPLSLPPEAPPRRRADRAERADRPGIEVPPSPSSFPDLDEDEHRAPPPGRPPPRRRGLLRYLILLLVVLALILWLVFRSGPQAPQQAEARSAKDQAARKSASDAPQRYTPLVAHNPIARQTLDTQAATVQQQTSVVQADQADTDTQRLNLTYCRTVAPLSGRVW